MTLPDGTVAQALREMLERATAVEPPIGPVAHDALLAGLRRRRRRRVSGLVAGLAVVAAVSVIVPSVRETGRVVSGPAAGAAPTLYVASIDGPVTVQSIATITNQAGKPIRTGDYDSGATEAVTPDRKTLYVADFKAQAVIPISTATGQVGTHIKVGEGPSAMAITPNGRTLYVVNEWSGTVTPISTATNTAGRAIRVRPAGVGMTSGIAITPDGKTAYVLCSAGGVVPVSTATDTAGRPIPGIHSGADALVIAP